MRFWRWALVWVGMLTAVILRADGDSQDFLLTPTKYDDSTVPPTEVENDNGATFGFSSPLCVKRPESRDGWGDGGEDRCYAKRDGVGLRKNRASALLKTFDQPDFITYVAVTVAVTTDTAANDKSLTLELAVRDDLAPVSQAFSFKGIGKDVPMTLIFTFEEGVNAEYLRLQNADEGNLFIVSRVVWKWRPPGIQATLSVPDTVRVGMPVRCSLAELSGGSGTYSRATFTFADQTITQEPVTPGLSVSFLAPELDGYYPLSVTVWDDLGASGTFTETIHVLPYSPPRNLRVTDVTRTGFTLEWDIVGVSPTEYRISAAGVPASETVSPRWRPEWTERGEACFVTREPLKLATWMQGAKASGFLQAGDWNGGLEVSFDGVTWKPLHRFGDLYLSLSVPASESQEMWVRATGEMAPPTLTPVLTVRRVYQQIIKEADGQRRTATFEGLPPGSTMQTVVSLCYLTGAGEELLVDSEPLTVELEPIPPFTSAMWADGVLTLTWPDDPQAVAGEFVVYAEREVPHTLPPGLYLTRTCFTASKDTEGETSGFSAGKGFVLTNTTAEPIHLDGKNYSLKYAKEGDSTRHWYFTHAVKDPETGEVETTHPFVVPAKGELFFSHSSYAIPEVREGVVSASIPNFTPEYTLTLLHNAEPVNAMGCATNAVCRLEEDCLDRVVTTPLFAGALDMSPFYDAWTHFSDVEYHRTLGLSKTSGNLTQMYLDPKTLVQDMEGICRIWAECVILDGPFRSEPLTVELWRAESVPPRKGHGFRLRLR